MCSNEQSFRVNNLIDYAPYHCGFGEKEVPSPYRANDVRPQELHSVSGHYAKIEVWFVLENSLGSRQNDVGEKSVFAVQENRALSAVIIGTSMSRMLDRIFEPSREILSYPFGEKKSNPSGLMVSIKASPDPLRITTRFW